MTRDPFAILGVDRRFDLDPEALRRRFLTASAQAHPDRFTDPLEQADAIETMSELTEAYRVLIDPESRARALLRLSGYESDADKDKLPPDLLMQVMEVREAMEEALHSNDKAALARLRDWATDHRIEQLQSLGTLLDGPLDSAVAGKARLMLNVIRYMQRMLEQMPD